MVKSNSIGMVDILFCIFTIIAIATITLTITTYLWNRSITSSMCEIHKELIIMNDRMEYISKIISKPRIEG